MIRRQRHSLCSLMPFIRSHLASVGSAAGQRGGQDGQPGWPAVQPQPMGQTDEAAQRSASLHAPQQHSSPATKPSLCGMQHDPCSPAFLLLVFSAVPSFIRLTLISEIRITWSGEETLQKWWIYFQLRKK